jgi:small-conductance mechanosensitive channel
MTFLTLCAIALPGASLVTEPESLFDLLDASVRRVLDWPLFSIGNMPVTLLFLVKCVLFLIALSLLTRVSRWILGNKILTHTKMDRGVQYALLRAFGYVVFLLGLIVGLDTSGLNLRSLLVVGGALGLGVGLGLQNIVSNFVAGLVILWEGPVKVGDLIEVGNTQGEVTRIGARGTWVRTFDNQVIIVPNSEFINQRVSNWTANDRVVRLSIPVGVSYDSDLNQVRETLLEIARGHAEVLPPRVPRKEHRNAVPSARHPHPLRGRAADLRAAHRRELRMSTDLFRFAPTDRLRRDRRELSICPTIFLREPSQLGPEMPMSMKHQTITGSRRDMDFRRVVIHNLPHAALRALREVSHEFDS